MQWYALYTKPRNEKKVVDLLERKGITAYCPIRKSVRLWYDRRKIVKEPLIPSYVFVQLNDYKKESVIVLQTPGAVRFLWWLNKPAVVKNKEINHLKVLLQGGDEYQAASLTHLLPGDRVKIVRGLWQENEGYLLRKEGKRVVLLIESLETVITVNIAGPRVRPS